MDPKIIGLLGAGLVMGISALGSALAMGIAGTAAVGAWKRCYKANKPAPMTLLTFVGFPLTQVFYGFILMGQIKAVPATTENAGLLLGLGVGAGIAIAASAIAEGKIGAAASDALSETGQGLVNYIAVLGICETVALFAMVLTMTSLG